MYSCDNHNPDNVFKRFKVVEFPTSFVSLSTTQDLDVDADLFSCALLKTTCEASLMKFEDAREISASHRAFNIQFENNHTIRITFKPLNECISRAKRKKHEDNRFVFDLRLLQVDGTKCCNNELHSEIGRYYISGQYEYCNITNSPTVIDFGEVILNTKVTKYVRIRNESGVIAAKFQYIKMTGVDVTPQKFTILPNSSKRVAVSFKPTCFKMKTTLDFKIKNPHDLSHDEFETCLDDENSILYAVPCQLRVIYPKKHVNTEIESLHKLRDLDSKYTYIDEELKTYNKNKKKAFNFLELSKSTHAKQNTVVKFSTGNAKCCSNFALVINKPDGLFCRLVRDKATIYDLFNITFDPTKIDFGRIGLNTYGTQDFKIKNDTRFDISIQLLDDECVLYTEGRLSRVNIKMKAKSELKVEINCLGFVEGQYKGTFEYMINNTYKRKHPYILNVGTPTLMIVDKSLKFGMVTSESFITSVPVRIYNNFNVKVDFMWDELLSETPFEIYPSSGSVPQHSCRICDVVFTCKATKTKTHEIEFISKCKTTKVIPLELSITTRKLSIKFLQPAVLFKDIALNLETIERVRLENSSREIALFHVVEPLLPGIKIEPMSGTIRAKMIITFEIIVKISCVMEFTYDILVKINNKENVILPISGNVVEPKITIQPKNIYMARIPCNMMTYVPLTLQNLSPLRATVEVLDTGDDNIFDVYVAQGNEKQKVFMFIIEGGQSKTVFIKVYDVFRREYEMYIPFKINGLLGPPDTNSWSTELQHYTGEYELYYENNPRVKLKTINKDISYCRIAGVITVPWVYISVDNFEIDYIPNAKNSIEFTMSNISKYYLYVTILTSKLTPYFSLDLETEENQSIINETNIKFELDRGKEARFVLKFHPKGHGRFVSTAVLFLDKHMTIPYYNLTFIGKRQTPKMTPSAYRIIFPPCYVGTENVRYVTLRLELESDLDSFSYMSKDEPNLSVKIIGVENGMDNDEPYTIATVQVRVCCYVTYGQNITLGFNHDCGSFCEVEVYFCFTHCVLTLHTNFLVKPEDNPYPYFPLKCQTALYDYLENCSTFLEKWMFQQGFRRDLFPVIPDTFHAISYALTSQVTASKPKGINVSYLNFIRRIAGPLMKHVRKISIHGVDDSFKCVKEIHDTYREIIYLMRSRGANLWVLQAKFLLSYDQFIIYSENVTPKCNADILLTQELLADVSLFNRLNKQSWIDFILQSYKVFVMDSCFFECVCVSSQPRDIVNVLVDWYNEQLIIQRNKIRKNKGQKTVANITTDLTDGIAIIMTIINYCPFIGEHFSIYCETDQNNEQLSVINNACLIIEALSILRLYFPITSQDFLQPNFLQMLFLSIHLYVTLPMFKPRDVIHFSPPLLRSSTRQVGISPASQESLIFSFIVLNNSKNNFSVEKAPAGENGKKMFLNVKYVANFLEKESCILLVHGYNKTRIFDTYIIFLLEGVVGLLNPLKKCKVTGPLYRPSKVDVLVASPFTTTATFDVYITDTEPILPVKFEDSTKSKFYVQRLNLIDKEITLTGIPKESGQELMEHKLYLQMICLSTQIGNSWIWFRSEVGEFFIRVTTQSRWDLAIDTIQAKVHTWPMDPCSCGEACECYRTTVLMIPHRNELMIKALRYALLEHASVCMMRIFDELIETTTGKIILGMLLNEGGTNMSEVYHILRSEASFRITSRALLPRLEHVTLAQHTGAMLPLQVTVPARDTAEKYSVIFTSDCGMDIRTYRIIFIETYEALSN